MTDSWCLTEFAGTILAIAEVRPASANEKPTALSTSPDGEQKGADKAQERGARL